MFIDTHMHEMTYSPDSFLKLEEIWVLADIVNGLMAIPNLIALIALSGVVVAETKAYQKHLAEEKNKEA